MITSLPSSAPSATTTSIAATLAASSVQTVYWSLILNSFSNRALDGPGRSPVGSSALGFGLPSQRDRRASQPGRSSLAATPHPRHSEGARRPKQTEWPRKRELTPHGARPLLPLG